jgi:hypothetical protein
VFYADPEKSVLFDTRARLCSRIVQWVHNPVVICEAQQGENHHACHGPNSVSCFSELLTSDNFLLLRRWMKSLSPLSAHSLGSNLCMPAIHGPLWLERCDFIFVGFVFSSIQDMQSLPRRFTLGSKEKICVMEARAILRSTSCFASLRL